MLTNCTGVAEASIGDMECHFTRGKEPEFVPEVEQYRLDLVKLTSKHSLGTGTQLTGVGLYSSLELPKV